VIAGDGVEHAKVERKNRIGKKEVKRGKHPVTFWVPNADDRLIIGRSGIRLAAC
jgi:hypothetical protein